MMLNRQNSRPPQWFVGSVDRLEVASVMAASLVLPPDLSQEELATSNIRLLKPTQHGPGAILHGGTVMSFIAGRYSPACTRSRSYVRVLPHGSLLTIKAERILIQRQ